MGALSRYLAGGAFAAIALAALTAAIWLGMARLDFVRRAARAEGMVTALNAGGSHPQIAFHTASGEAISYPQGGFIFGFKVGDKVAVLYDIKAPRQSAIVQRFGALWFLPGLFAAGAAAFAIAAWQVLTRVPAG